MELSYSKTTASEEIKQKIAQIPAKKWLKKIIIYRVSDRKSS
jgi:hypothetical protein